MVSIVSMKPGKLASSCCLLGLHVAEAGDQEQEVDLALAAEGLVRAEVGLTAEVPQGLRATAPLSPEPVVEPASALLAALVPLEVSGGAEVGPGWLEAKPVSAAGPLQARIPTRRAREVVARPGIGSV
jgi:hypothetical protein